MSVPTGVREATDADWAAIWPIWREVVEAGETYAYPLGATSEQARGWWFDGSRVTVLEEGDRVLGSAKMGPNRPGRGAHVGTASFMVDAAARGRGIGRRLADDMVAWHRGQGFAGIQFNAVVETNVAAVRLWQQLGFEVVGTVPRAFDSASHGRVGLHVMYLDLARPHVSSRP
ncbi:GNAT family N-acetyltransferase [Nocardioides sp. zg-1228]|uniref:GNAT family N-acetyltransferase n=1 Tax=Nocardioides sp. zg-1228 TaxID=2763008 RepID=UPI0016423856|nr:GNAT family N-acetyltransferase [Nocardioides sp. zg-1228]MBC2935157.1 GNAT family N-acetyltransferase [Nocardioides sp. zg-1228]QSF56975.1 GNAT family N-acetyltransferase [Nocardioides sp. zg-1228]